MASKQNFTVEQGSTFDSTVRWETTPLLYKPITGIENSAPVSITCVGHGVPNGWQVAVIDVKGMTELNAANSPPEDDEFRPATVVSANELELNDISSAGFKTYKSGGSLVYYTPQALTGYTARMAIRARIGATAALATLTTENGGITINAAAFTIALFLSAADTAAFTWTKGVYDLELVAPITGRVTRILSGTITVSKEATT